MAMTAVPEVDVDTETDQRTKRQPPYIVVLHNDDYNGMDFVLVVLRKVFGYEVEKCMEIMQEAHEKGRAIAWTGAMEVAELKADQIHSCGGDPRNEKAQPLQATIEPSV